MPKEVQGSRCIDDHAGSCAPVNLIDESHLQVSGRQHLGEHRRPSKVAATQARATQRTAASDAEGLPAAVARHTLMPPCCSTGDDFATLSA